MRFTMCPSNDKKSDIEKLDFIINESFEALQNNEDDLKKVFREEGLDYDETVKEGKQFIANLKREYRFKKAEEKKIMILKIIDHLKNKTLDKLKAELAKTFSVSDTPVLAPAFFHKLEKLTNQDLEDISLEQEILKIIESELNKDHE